MNNLWNDATQLSVQMYELKVDVQNKINRGMFVLMYALDKDLLIYALSKKLREDKVNVPDDMVEDIVGKLVEELWAEMYLEDSEIKKFLKNLENNIRMVLVNSPKQKEINNTLDWMKLKK